MVDFTTTELAGDCHSGLRHFRGHRRPSASVETVFQSQFNVDLPSGSLKIQLFHVVPGDENASTKVEL